MTSYAYEAVDLTGFRIAGTLDVASQREALQRIKEMDLFPTSVVPRRHALGAPAPARPGAFARLRSFSFPRRIFAARVKPVTVCVFTRQLATLVDAGLPLLRGLRILAQQETNRTLKRVIGEVGPRLKAAVRCPRRSRLTPGFLTGSM